MPQFLTPGDFDPGSYCNQCGENWIHMLQNTDSSYTCTVCAAHHRHGPTAPSDVLTKAPGHLKRGQKRTYNPRTYVYSVLVKASGGGKHKVDNTVLSFLQDQGVKEIQDVRETMRAMGLGHKYHTFAACYASRLGGYVPVLDQHESERLLNAHDHFLRRFHEPKHDGQLPVARRHEPHTGMTLRRVAHHTGQHHLEPCFRDLRSRQRKKTESVIAAVFLDLGWPRPGTCD